MEFIQYTSANSTTDLKFVIDNNIEKTFLNGTTIWSADHIYNIMLLPHIFKYLSDYEL